MSGIPMKQCEKLTPRRQGKEILIVWVCYLSAGKTELFSSSGEPLKLEDLDLDDETAHEIIKVEKRGQFPRHLPFLTWRSISCSTWVF